jgi:hypothetical protein
MKRTLDRLTTFNHFLVQREHFPHISQVSLASQGMAFSCLLHSRPVQAVALVRSSDYWESRLHLPESTGRKQRAPIGLVVCFRHDSVVPCHVLSLEDGREYQPEDLPGKYPNLQAVRNEHSRYAAKVFLGALLCGVKAAHDILMDKDTMPESTRRRYEAKMHMYQRRRQGRPLFVEGKKTP